MLHLGQVILFGIVLTTESIFFLSGSLLNVILDSL